MRRARLRAKRNIRETAEALEVSHVVLGEIERGRRPLSWEQVETLCQYLDVPNPELWHAALTQFHHEIWSGQKGPGVILEEQIEKVASLPLDCDVVEVVAALRSAISSMDIAKGALERANRIVRHPNCGSYPGEFVRDSETMAQASLLLEASMSVAQRVLKSPTQPLPEPEVEDTKESNLDSFENESLAQRDDDKGVEKSFVPRLSLDFDGVVHSYQSGWAGDACVIPDPPVPGAFTFITEAIERGMDVNIFSTRSHVEGATEAMREWLIEHGMEEKVANLVRFPKKKPNAILLIDDRGFHFKGTFPSFEYIDGFKPWNKGGERDDGGET